MKRFLKFLGITIVLLIIILSILYFKNNEPLPQGKQGKDADNLANKMLVALNNEAYKNTEIIEWSFRNTNFYKWYKKQNIVEVSWEKNKVILNTKSPEKSDVFIDGKKTDNKTLVQKAISNFNNDSFWLVAPHKVFDNGVERRIVKHNNQDALLITYTSGGTTPGDSYLWILDENGLPTDYKMWTKIIPIGGVGATWNEWKTTEAGIKLPKNHTLSIFGMQIDMGDVKATNPKSDGLANKILKAINHDAYTKTKTLEWSFGGRRSYKWDKKAHIAEVSWDTIKVVLHTNDLEKSTIYYNDKLNDSKDKTIIKKAEDYFNNDSFWLVAPHKLFEKGIIRTKKEVDGKEALLVKYTTGGTTPGDSYLWLLDDDYIPVSYKMYVPSMKMDGVSATWKDWITTKSGTLLPTNHTFGKDGVLSMGEVKGYN